MASSLMKNSPASALLTDFYQLAMAQAYFESEMNDTAVFELFVRRLPPRRHFLVAAGLEQAVDYLEQLRFTGALQSRSHGATYGSLRRAVRAAGLR